MHKGKQEISVGEAHCDNRMEFDRENHEIQEVMDQEPRRPKLDLNGLWSRPPDLPYGLAGPLPCPPTSRFIHSQVCSPYILFSHFILSVSNWIKNPFVGVWPPVSIRQDMGRTIRGGPAHKIKACTALLDVYRKILYSTK